MLFVLTTIDEKEKAERIGRILLEKHMIACYNMWPVQSAYHWKGDVVEEQGFTMLLKTTNRWFEDIADIIKAESGDDVPEVISFESERVDGPYQRWLNDTVA